MFQRLKVILLTLIVGIIGTLAVIVRLQRQKKVDIDVTRTTVVTQLRSAQKLITAEMTLQKVIEGKQVQNDYLPGSQRDNTLQDFFFKDKLVLEAESVIDAGFNLESLNTGSVIVNDDLSLTINLPAPEILSRRLTEDTKPFSRQLGVFTKGNVELETLIRTKALEQFQEEAIQKGILVEAEKNALSAFQHLFGTVGMTVRDVHVERTTPLQ